MGIDVRNGSNDQTVIMLVANKIDLHREVSREEGETFAKEHGLLFQEASAKTAANVDDAFVDSARHIYEKVRQGLVDPSMEAHGVKLGHATATSAARPEQTRMRGGGCC